MITERKKQGGNKIVFINQATGYLTIDIINEFSKEFDDVALITGSIRVQDTDLEKKVKIAWITKYNRGSAVRKGISWILGTIQISFLLQFRFRKYERFFFTIPPTAYLFALNQKTNFSIAVYDLFPDALKIIGLKQNGLIYKWWSQKNKCIFQKAHRIYALSEKMKSKILFYSKETNIRVIPNWTAFSGYTPVTKDRNSIIERENLIGKLIVQYSGNIGATHNIETIIEVAEQLTDVHDIQFLIIGRGDRTNAIGNLIKNKGLKNCRLIPYRKDEELYESLCAADLAIVILDERTSNVSVPSKLYNHMAAGIPILAIASLNSAIAGIVVNNNIGRVFEKDNIIDIKSFILECKLNEIMRSELAENSLKTSLKYNRTNASEYLKSYIE